MLRGRIDRPTFGLHRADVSIDTATMSDLLKPEQIEPGRLPMVGYEQERQATRLPVTVEVNGTRIDHEFLLIQPTIVEDFVVLSSDPDARALCDQLKLDCAGCTHMFFAAVTGIKSIPKVIKAIAGAKDGGDFRFATLHGYVFYTLAHA